MGKGPVDHMLTYIIILTFLWMNTLAQESKPMCTTNAIFEYCLSQQGLNVSQSKAILCSVDHAVLGDCQFENEWNCPFSSPIYHDQNFTDPFFDLLKECISIGRDSSQCLSSPCLNGGTCTQYGPTQVCVCPFEFYGSECEMTYGSTACTLTSCQNGGSCVKFEGTEKCLCTVGYWGERCDTTRPNFDPGSTPCTPTSCQNGGSCYAGRCLCTSGYRGDTCGIPDPQSTLLPGVTDKPCVTCEGENGNSDSIGVGMIVGIAIGAVVVLLLFAILLAVLLKSKRRKQDSTQPSIPLSTTHPRRRNHRPPVNLTPESRRNAPDPRLPEDSLPTTDNYKKKDSSPRPPTDGNRHPQAITSMHPPSWVGDYLTPIPSERHYQTHPEWRIPKPEHHPKGSNTPKSKSRGPVAKLPEGSPPTDDYRHGAVVSTEVPLRWKEDFVTPIPSERHYPATRETSDGYLRPVAQDPDVYEGEHVYTEIDEN